MKAGWRAFFWLWLLAVLVGPQTCAAEEPLYPFVDGRQWGYIDATGAWKIAPAFDWAGPFEKAHAMVEKGGKWGIIDRRGEWIVPPICTTNPWPKTESGACVLTVGKKKGLLRADGKRVLEIAYDDIWPFGERAWVRRGNKVGLLAMDGHWILEPSLKWPAGAPLPEEINADGVAWFRHGNRWGLLSAEGKVLFAPRFTAHVLGRRETDVWDHPEGLDFKNGSAWVQEEDRWLLIDAAGQVLGKFDWAFITPWSDELDLVHTRTQTLGLVSRKGKIVLPAAYEEIQPLRDGVARVTKRSPRKNEKGKTEFVFTTGIVDARGQFLWPCEERSVEWGPFSDGLAAARKYEEGQTRAGYIDPQGREAIPFQYNRTEPFSDGLGAFSIRRPEAHQGTYVQDFQFGFVDRSGKVAIEPQFELVTPFCKGRAWVAARGAWAASQAAGKWAMIDRGGKVLTDWTFDPPEKQQRMFGGEQGQVSVAARWRGELALISRNDKLGLATADGRILVEPRFQGIREFKSGMAVVYDSVNGKMRSGFINERGELVVPLEYWQEADFDGDVTWASINEEGRAGLPPAFGWFLIDRTGKRLHADPVVAPSWARTNIHLGNPLFVDDLACVARAKDRQPDGAHPEQKIGWGYVDRTGKIVAWFSPPEDGKP